MRPYAVTQSIGVSMGVTTDLKPHSGMTKATSGWTGIQIMASQGILETSFMCSVTPDGLQRFGVAREFPLRPGVLNGYQK